nr:WPE palindromic element domain-containing protein [Wolbachia endosymbiont of Cylisticus convexus]
MSAPNRNWIPVSSTGMTSL